MSKKKPAQRTKPIKQPGRVDHDSLPLAPENPDQLHAWLREHLGIHLPRKPVIEGHAAPFDYLSRAFFDDFTSGPVAAPTDILVWANRGGGKTYLGALATLLDLLYKPTIAIRVLAGSLDQSRRMLHYLHGFFAANPAFAAELKGRTTAGRVRMRTGGEVEVLAQSQTSVRGTHVQKLRCDEVDLFDPQIWDAAQFITHAKQCGEVFVRGSVECLSTMQHPHGLMHRLLMEAQEGKRTLFKWGALDVLERCGNERLCQGLAIANPKSEIQNPKSADTSRSISLTVLPYASLAAPCPLLAECKGAAKHRPTDQAGHLRIEDAIAKKGRVSLETWETEMLCARPRRTDAVLPEFDPKLHIFDHAPPARGTWLAGMDFGMRAPTAVLWAILDDSDTLWIMDERYAAGCVLEEHVLAMRSGLAKRDGFAWPHPRWVAADPAGRAINLHTGVSDVSVLKRAGFEVRTPAGAVERGLSHIRARLRPAASPSLPRLFIHRRCENLIRSLTEYHYKPGDLYATEPLKDGNDHAVDALRYMVMSIDPACESRHGNYLAA